MTAHLLSIGDEILIGQIIDTNSAWMSQQLNLRGIAVTGKSSVGDTREAIVSGVRHASACAQVVIMTGGLGPTKDDITKKTLAEMFDSEMFFDQTTYDRIEGYFTKIGRPMPIAMRDQATLPRKAQILVNKVGTAPGMWFESNDVVYVSLPGVPFEMEYLMTHEVMPRLTARFQSRPIVHRTILTACEGESNIAKRIESVEDQLPAHIKLAYLPALGQVRLRLTGVWPGEVNEESEVSLAAELDREKAKIEAIIPELIYGYEEESLQSVIGRLLLKQGKQLGTAESCTGGYIAHLITSVAGSSAYYPGSVIAYSYDMKRKFLGVKDSTLQKQGAVSEACIREMAEGAIKALGVDVSLAVSGIAGPDGGTPDKPVGTVWMAVSDGKSTIVQKQIFGRDRLKNIQLTATYALNLLRRFLED